MQHRHRFALTLIICFISSFAVAQQWPHTLLWRISGNGLSKPSYLYGTMHLTDRRLFNFGDSLYHAIETTDGLALELNFRDYIDTILTRQMQADEQKELDAERMKYNGKKLQKSADTVLKKFGVQKENLTQGDLRKIRETRIREIAHEDMPTFLDAYIYGLALRQGKWTGGIEDVVDQLDLRDETGAQLTPEKVLQPEAALRRSVEDFIRVYTTQDLDKVLQMINASNLNFRDEVLIHRNIKMARRMDSLSAIRSMVFAVGAAHLPGDSGVIELLRRRGFQVDPVFSSKKVFADVYAQQLSKVPWAKVEDEEKLYTIEMPGEASDHNIFGQAVKMKTFMDITTGIFYMIGQSVGASSTDIDAEKAFRHVVGSVGGDSARVKAKAITQSGASGYEGSFTAGDAGYRLRMLQKNNQVYIIFAGADKKINLGNADVTRYFSSFVAHEPRTDRPRVAFGLPEKAFHISLPGQPKANAIVDRYADGSNWLFTTYDYLDNNKGLYYLVQVRDLKEGFNLENDSVYFQLYAKEFSKRVTKISRNQISSYQGFPCLYFDGLAEKDGVAYRTFNVIRGYRVYSCIVGGPKASDFSDADGFFNSMVLDSYQPGDWKSRTGDGFSTTAPGEFKKINLPARGMSVRRGENYSLVAYDPKQAIYYQVMKRSFSPLYWTRDSISFLEEQARRYYDRDNEVLRKEYTHNGTLSSLDLVIGMRGYNLVERVRVMISGDTLYTLTAHIPRPYVDSPSYARFFDDFRTDHETPTRIYTDKSEALLKALATNDSADFHEAELQLTAIHYTAQDLPFLHRVLFETYIDAQKNYNVNSKVAILLSDMGDNSVVPLVEKKYSSIPLGRADFRFDLLNMLAGLHTRQSFNLLGKLIVQDPPATKRALLMQPVLLQTPQLATRLYPGILALISDSLYNDMVIDITTRLLDSSLLSPSMLEAYRPMILAYVDGKSKSFSETDSYSWRIASAIRLLGYMSPDLNTSNLLLRFQKTSVLPVRKEAIVALLRGDPSQHPMPDLISGVAADLELRKSFYYDLERIGQRALFPAAYATPQALTATDVYNRASEEHGIDSVAFIAERVASFNGQPQKFYLYRVVTKAGGKENTYLGVAPAHSDHPGAADIDDLTGVYWEEALGHRTLEEQLRQYLEKAGL